MAALPEITRFGFGFLSRAVSGGASVVVKVAQRAARSPIAPALNRFGGLGKTAEYSAERMLEVARRMAKRLGVNPNEIYRVKDLGNAVGQMLGGKIFLDPKAFRAGFDKRLGRMVGPLENLARTIIHEHAHVMQSIKHPDAYWGGLQSTVDLFEKIAYRFEDLWYGALR